MNIRPIIKFYRYAFARENYALLMRAVYTAWLVYRKLPDRVTTPRLIDALPLVNDFYLVPQPGWRISDAEKVARFASFIVNFPFRWGKCFQQSLILYRLLNGYGIAARICIGIDRKDRNREGHVWVEKLGENIQAIGEPWEPSERYQMIFTSPLPENLLKNRE